MDLTGEEHRNVLRCLIWKLCLQWNITLHKLQGIIKAHQGSAFAGIVEMSRNQRMVFVLKHFLE